MTRITNGVRGLQPHIVGARFALSLMAILTVALIPSLILLAIAQTKPVSAAAQTTGGSNPAAVAAELSGDEESDGAESVLVDRSVSGDIETPGDVDLNAAGLTTGTYKVEMSVGP